MNNDISKAVNENRVIRKVFCDTSRAFDRVWPKGLLFNLRSNGISENIICLFKYYLFNRQQRVCVKEEASLRKYIAAGVPQVSILGPILFFIYDIVICCNIRLFANDTSLYVIVENPT